MANYFIHPSQFLNLKLHSTSQYLGLSCCVFWVFLVTLSFLVVAQLHIYC